VTRVQNQIYEIYTFTSKDRKKELNEYKFIRKHDQNLSKQDGTGWYRELNKVKIQTKKKKHKTCI